MATAFISDIMLSRFIKATLSRPGGEQELLEAAWRGDFLTIPQFDETNVVETLDKIEKISTQLWPLIQYQSEMQKKATNVMHLSPCSIVIPISDSTIERVTRKGQITYALTNLNTEQFHPCICPNKDQFVLVSAKAYTLFNALKPTFSFTYKELQCTPTHQATFTATNKKLIDPETGKLYNIFEGIDYKECGFVEHDGILMSNKWKKHYEVYQQQQTFLATCEKEKKAGSLNLPPDSYPEGAAQELEPSQQI